MTVLGTARTHELASPGLPNLIIAGVHKAGTTAVYSYLAKHPDVCPSYKKEINYYLPLLTGGEPAPIEEYESNFDHWRGERFRLEASPSYVYGKRAVAQRIKEDCPGARVLVVLRDPVERLLSFFSRAVASSVLPKELSFGEYVALSFRKQDEPTRDVYVRGVREGFYVDYLRPWQELFGRDFRVFFFDDLKRDPQRLTADICSWLGLDAGCYRPQDFTVENRTVHYRYRAIHRFVHEGYMATERFWRRNHRLKQRLREVYNRLNADANRGPSGIDAATLCRLKEIYAPYNEDLKRFLLAHDYRSLPAWLD